MSPDLMNYLPLILLGLVALVLAVWVLARLSRKARVIEDESGAPLARDVLEEGAAPAARNQARGFSDMALFEVGPAFHGGEPGEHVGGLALDEAVENAITIASCEPRKKAIGDQPPA